MIKFRKFFYILSSVLVIVSIISLVVFGLPLGIDFKGGSFLELKFISDEAGNVNVLSREEILSALSELSLGTIQVQETDGKAVILKFRDIDEETHQLILEKLRNAKNIKNVEVEGEEVIELSKIELINFEEEKFESIGPVIGRETMRKSFIAMGLVFVMIVVYVAWAFRKISYPIGSIRYGIIALVALFHDILITLGVFALYASYTNSEIGVPFIAALLTILGYSVNDTIVVFDRVRENLFKLGDRISFEKLVSKSVRESLVRSINTSATTLSVLFAVFFFGGPTIHNFVFALIVGISIGTYSSLALASPLLVTWASRSESS